MGIISISEGNEEKFLKSLTSGRCIPSIPFAGRYRLVDFTLSSMVNSGITNVGIFPMYKYRSLMDHLGAGKEWDLNRRRDGLFILPPNPCTEGNHQSELEKFYFHHDYFRRSSQELIVYSKANMVMNIDFREALEFHKQSKADITAVYKSVTNDEIDISRVRKVEMNKKGRITTIEKQPGILDSNKVCMEMFILDKYLFMNIVNTSLSKDYHDFIEDGIIQNMNSLKIFGFPYNGYLGSITSVKSYMNHSMDMLNPKVLHDLFHEPGYIYTKVKDEAPTKYARSARVKNSLIANGCVIEGNIENSIIFRGAHIHKNSNVINSIVMQWSKVEEGVVLKNVILDKEVHVTFGKRLEYSEDAPIVISKRTRI